ncbi:MAG TPA: hypothetical protein PLC89_05120 [Haliscomenobacter sp.]|uniref:hypothetical protein n=1 Tax=Haliscomenobacter sp. TaxID=2717303 RepID=UPI002B89AAFA|nr:hypothetical protein [Haliscomenobacter sp.]HOY16646.1 hypothetical protein [Haliscomenobacter sp.]
MTKKSELIADYFPNIYLAVISLLQGIALSQLVPIFLTYVEIAEHPWLDIHLLPILLMLLIIFTIWHHYAISIFFLRWFPNIIDTLVPFLVGVSQFVLISYLNIETSLSDMKMDDWTLGFAIFLMSGSFPYLAAAWRLEVDLFANMMSKKNALRHGELTKKYYKWAGYSIFVQGLFVMLIVLLHQDRWLLFSLILLLSHLLLFEYCLLYRIKPHYVKSMDEFEADGHASR